MTRRLILAGFVCLNLACQPLSGAGQRPPGTRRVLLQLPQSLLANLGAQTTGAQLLAIRLGEQILELQGSPAVELSRSRRLEVFLPVAESPVLVIQTPSASTGRLIARLVMDDGLGGLRSRLPAGLDDLDLGEPSLTTAEAPRLLTIDVSHNPLATSDLDGDGIQDLQDDDDDGDGQPDRDDADADGDGIDDSLQGYSALPDADQDGIADIFSRN